MMMLMIHWIQWCAVDGKWTGVGPLWTLPLRFSFCYLSNNYLSHHVLPHVWALFTAACRWETWVGSAGLWQWRSVLPGVSPDMGTPLGLTSSTWNCSESHVLVVEIMRGVTKVVKCLHCSRTIIWIPADAGHAGISCFRGTTPWSPSEPQWCCIRWTLYLPDIMPLSANWALSRGWRWPLRLLGGMCQVSGRALVGECDNCHYWKYGNVLRDFDTITKTIKNEPKCLLLVFFNEHSIHFEGRAQFNAMSMGKLWIVS